MSTQTAFHRCAHPLLRLLLPEKEKAVPATKPDRALRERIELLGAKSTEGKLTAKERDEYDGCVRANKFVATLRRVVRAMKSVAAP
jgi:hypothetical protein